MTGRLEAVEKQISLFDTYNNTFPSGLVYQFDDYLFENHGIRLNIVDRRFGPEPKNILSPNFTTTAFQHQAEAVTSALDFGRGIIVCPTGSGKTRIALTIIAELGLKTLYLINSLDLLSQTKAELEKCFPGQDIGIIGDSEFNPKYITVATIQTLWARFNLPETQDFLKSIEVLIGDEVHHVGANVNYKASRGRPSERYPGNSLYSVIQAASNAFYRFGFSATIGRKGTLRRVFLDATIGKPIYVMTYEQTKATGILADVIVLMLKTPHLKRFSNYPTAYTENVQRNNWVHNQAARISLLLAEKNKSSLLFVNRLHTQEKSLDSNGFAKSKKVAGHAKILFSLFESIARGKVKLLTGEIPESERNRIRDLICNKKVLTAITTIMKEGIDIPSLDATIYLGGGRAETDNSFVSESNAAIQALGRALRNPGGIKNQKRAIHIDIFYNDGKGFLAKHALERVSSYKEYGYRVFLVDEINIIQYIFDWFNSGEIDCDEM